MSKRFFRRIVVICSIFLLFNTLSWSIGAYPYPITVTQPDGTQITIKLHGDEWYNWTTSTDGYRLIKNSKGVFEYAQLKSGSLVASGVKASNAGVRTSTETGFVQTLSKTLSTSDLQIASVKRSSAQQAIHKAIASRVNKAQTGTFKLLVILANFSDTQTSYQSEDFDALLNTNVGSFHDFYLENSNGTLNVVSSVTAWVTLPNTHDYYGPEDRWGEFAYQAIKAAYTAGVDMSQFDNDGDGVIDGVAIYHQGNGQEASADTKDIWSHAWSLSSAGYSPSACTFGTVKADGYFTQPELLSRGSELTTIGVICHEFGHILGAYDFYDTDYEVNGQYDGTGSWDLMAAGAYNGFPSGSSPAHHNPYTKIAYGWITPQVLSKVQSVKLPPVLTSQQVLRVNTTTANEYFLLENRVQKGFDSNIPGAGMLIYHVDGDYIAQHADSNNVNAYAHQGFYIKKAYNAGDLDSDGTPFPGSSSNTSFTDITTPAALSWSGNLTNQSITNIADVNDTITFDFMELQDGVPTSFTGTLQNESSVLLNWSRAKENYPVLIAYSTDNTFGNPVDGQVYAPGDEIAGGGKVVYYGADVQSFLHQSDVPERIYYYRIWSNKQVSYTSYLGTSVNGLTTISFNVTDLNSQALSGAQISINGEQIQTKSDGTASVRGIYPDGIAYAYSSHLEGYEDKWGAFLSADSVLLDIQMIPVDTTVVAFTNTTVNGNSIGLSWNPVVNDNFSGYEPFSTTIPNWTQVDKDKLSTYGAEDFDFPNENYTGSFIVFDGYYDGLIADGVAISSYADRQVLACMSAAPTTDITSPKNDDWLISPQMEVTDTMWLSFMARSVSDKWGLERIRVLVSNGETTTSSFTSLSSGTYMKVPTSWTFYKYNLTGYKGQTVRFAINCVSADAFMLLLDCIKISKTEPFKPGAQSLKSASVDDIVPAFKRSVASGNTSTSVSQSRSYKKSDSVTPGTLVYTISRNGEVIDQVTDLTAAYTDQVDNCGEYVYQISTNKANATNDYVIATSAKNKVANCVSKADVTIDSSTGMITVQLPDGQSYADYDVFNMAGERVLLGSSEHYRFEINASGWLKGVYLLHLRYLQGDEAVKILIK
jgi:M6 family metalloprotease-like protein